MKVPTTNQQEILFTLIQNGKVSLFDFPYLAGFRTRISELRKMNRLMFKTKIKQGINKFGRSYNFHSHILVDKASAELIYLQLTK